MKGSESHGQSNAIRSTDDGLHLEGSILWLDAIRNGELSFLSSAGLIPPSRGPQFIATEETLKILEANHKKPKALVCQYNRPFSIGKLKMELLPSGGVLGGASLHLEHNNKRILYAPNLQTQKTDLSRTMQLKKAHTLIINASHPNPTVNLPNRRKEKERLLAAVEALIERGIYPIIRCLPMAIAQELTKFLSDSGIPIAVHSSIYRIHKVYESYGSNLGRYSLHSPKYAKKKVLIYPLQDQHVVLRRPLPEVPTFFVEDSLDEGDAFQPDKNSDRFIISSCCEGRELREIITAVAPKEVYVFGPYAKRYTEELKNCGARVRPLYPYDQPTLF